MVDSENERENSFFYLFLQYFQIDKEGMMTIPLANGNVMKVPLNPINISEEMNKSGIWKDINHEGDAKPNSDSKKKK